MKKNSCSLILPCYNEAEHFSSSVKRILTVLEREVPQYEVIFVEDASTDTTRALIKELLAQKKDKHLKAIFHKTNLGRGASVADGIREAQGEWVGFIDIDCEISPQYIPQFVSRLEMGDDVVCGQRKYHLTLRGLLRFLASSLYAQLMRIILQTNLKDTEAGYKFFNRKKIIPVLNEVQDQKWFWDTEIMVRSQLHGLRISSLPVDFHRRIDKKSTVRLISDTVAYLQNVVRFRQEIAKHQIIQKNMHDYWQRKSPAFSNQYHKFLGVPTSAVGWFLEARHRVISRILSNTDGKVFLDVGCGSGVFMEVALRLNKYAIGIDYSAQMIETARNNLRSFSSSRYQLFVGSATKLPVRSRSVDVVLASGLTDYLSETQTQQFFAEIDRVVKNKATAIVTFPRAESPMRFLRSGIGLWMRQNILHLPPMETAYSKADIEKLFSSIHMQTIEWKSVLTTMWVVVGVR